jgi:tRNA G18 (ribose-2'-O)-methylase SpoU
LVGDGIENPANAVALADAAAMFGIPSAFRDYRGLVASCHGLPTVDTTDLLAGQLVAVENTPGGEPVFTACLPPGPTSIVVGNERRGVRPDVLRAAVTTVTIPMPGRRVNTLNVAAAAAVALYYLRGASGRRRVFSPRPESQRPAVLLLAPTDHVEAGSTLRSAAAFGWPMVGIDDREKVWFGTPRPVRTEGRAAARSHRSPLRVLPTSSPPAAARVVVAGIRVAGPPLHRVDLLGRNTLLVLPDEHGRHGYGGSARVEYARVEVPGAAYRYRLVTSIVLAEAARQLGIRTGARPRRPYGVPAPPGKRRRQAHRYDSALATVDPDGELLTPADLVHY